VEPVIDYTLRIYRHIRQHLMADARRRIEERARASIRVCGKEVGNAARAAHRELGCLAGESVECVRDGWRRARSHVSKWRRAWREGGGGVRDDDEGEILAWEGCNEAEEEEEGEEGGTRSRSRSRRPRHSMSMRGGAGSPDHDVSFGDGARAGAITPPPIDPGTHPRTPSLMHLVKEGTGDGEKHGWKGRGKANGSSGGDGGGLDIKSQLEALTASILGSAMPLLEKVTAGAAPRRAASNGALNEGLVAGAVRAVAEGSVSGSSALPRNGNLPVAVHVRVDAGGDTREEGARVLEGHERAPSTDEPGPAAATAAVHGRDVLAPGGNMAMEGEDADAGRAGVVTERVEANVKLETSAHQVEAASWEREAPVAKAQPAKPAPETSTIKLAAFAAKIGNTVAAAAAAASKRSGAAAAASAAAAAANKASYRERAARLRTANLEIMAALETFESRLQELKVWNVRFQRKIKLKWGESLFLVGGCEALGDGDNARALPMTYSPSDVWSVTASKVPEGTRYRYFIRKDSGEEHFLTDYWFELVSALDKCKVLEGRLDCDDTFQYIRFRVDRRDADQVSVTGSLPELGNWDTTQALALQRLAGTDTWEETIKIPSGVLADFQYKFFERPSAGCADWSHVNDAGIRFESGPNRISDAHLVLPTPPPSAFNPKP